MSNTSEKKIKSTAKDNKEVKVLYQNLGGSLYAFTEINGQVFFGKVPVKQSTKTNDDKKTQPAKNARV